MTVDHGSCSALRFRDIPRIAVRNQGLADTAHPLHENLASSLSPSRSFLSLRRAYLSRDGASQWASSWFFSRAAPCYNFRSYYGENTRTDKQSVPPGYRVTSFALGYFIVLRRVHFPVPHGHMALILPSRYDFQDFRDFR
jgi:hypothetical protein